jgi:hypothetical protein
MDDLDAELLLYWERKMEGRMHKIRGIVSVLILLAICLAGFLAGLLLANAFRINKIVEQRIIPEWCIARDNVAGQAMEGQRQCVEMGKACEETLGQCKGVLGKCLLKVQELGGPPVIPSGQVPTPGETALPQGRSVAPMPGVVPPSR